jgi:hypothetical protein
MSAIAHEPAAFELRHGAEGRVRGATVQPLWLRPTEDGWSLMGANGDVIFRGLGRGARRECLELARDLGVLAVLS